MSWPPKIGELLPGWAEPAGSRVKLLNYCLNTSHEHGGTKAKGFERALGISVADVDHLVREIEAGISVVSVCDVRDNEPYGFTCAVDVPVRGLDTRQDKMVDVRTVWEIAYEGARPRLVTAYPRT